MDFINKISGILKDKNHILKTYGLTFLVSYFSISANLVRVENQALSYVFVGLVILLLTIYALICRNNFSWKLSLAIPVVYWLYLIILYFLKMSMNLANEAFDYRLFEGFFQYNFLVYLIFFLTLVYLSPFFIRNNQSKSMKRVNKRKARFIQIKSPQASLIILSQITSIIFMTSTLFRETYLNNTLFHVEDKVFLVNSFYLLIYSLTFFVLLSLIIYSFFMTIRQVAHNKVSIHSALATSVLWAIVVNYFVQAGITENWTWYMSFQIPGAFVFQVSFLAGIYLLIYALFNRYLIATVINLFLGIALAVINSLKYQLRNEPLLVGDFIWIRDIQFFKAYITPTMAWSAGLGFLLVSSFLFLTRKRLVPGPMMKLYQRLIIIGTFATTLYTSFVVIGSVNNKQIAAGVPVLSSVYNGFSKPWLGLNASAKFQSVSFLWFKQLTATTMDQPLDYSEERIAELYEKYMARAEEINSERKNNLSDQTVIYILSESLADPSRLPGISLSQYIIPNIRELQEQTTSGLMKSDGYGGGTANMEFQTLTGLPMYNFNEMVSVLYTEVVPKMAMIPSISDAFEKQDRYVIHLNNASNYSRRSVYSKLNFDTFVATGGGNQEPVDTSLFGNNYSDEASYNNVLALLDESQSQFFSLLTIQNHSPWGVTSDTDIIGTGEGFTTEQNESLTNYARLLYQTDIKTQEFLDKLEELDKDITVVFYGDHLPSLYPQEVFSANPELQYQAEFFIWSNHDDRKMDEISYVNSSDFPALLLEHTNSKVSGYYALLTDVLHQASVNQTELSEVQQLIADDLALIQYDLTQGKKYIQQFSDFFLSK